MSVRRRNKIEGSYPCEERVGGGQEGGLAAANKLGSGRILAATVKKRQKDKLYESCYSDGLCSIKRTLSVVEHPDATGSVGPNSTSDILRLVRIGDDMTAPGIVQGGIKS